MDRREAREAEQRYREKHRVKLNARMRERRRLNIGDVNGKAKRRMNQRRAEVRSALMIELGGKCCRCGMTDKRVLQIDHVNGDGFKYRSKLKSGTRRAGGEWFRDYLNGRIDKYQILCANCHCIKTWENKEFEARKAVGHKTCPPPLLERML
jgi:hypothetical protein